MTFKGPHIINTCATRGRSGHAVSSCQRCSLKLPALQSQAASAAAFHHRTGSCFTCQETGSRQLALNDTTSQSMRGVTLGGSRLMRDLERRAQDEHLHLHEDTTGRDSRQSWLTRNMRFIIRKVATTTATSQQHAATWQIISSNSNSDTLHGAKQTLLWCHRWAETAASACSS